MKAKEYIMTQHLDDPIQLPIIIGKFGAPFGVKGWIKLHSFTEPPENIFDYPWLIEKQKKVWQPQPFASYKIQGNGLIVKIPNIDDRDEVRVFTNKQIATPREAFTDEALATEQYYWVDLIGLTVVNLQQQVLGVVDHLYDSLAHDMLVVKNHHQQTILIPYVLEKFIKSVSLEQKQIIVDWDPPCN